MLYFAPVISVELGQSGGATIADVVRRAWSRLVRKQWLFLYPVALAVVDTLAFLAVYAAADGPLSWSRFFAASFERGAYIRDHFIVGFELDSALGVAICAGLASCLFAGLLLAPLFHAVAGPGYPRAPRRVWEAVNLFVFYLLSNLVLWVAPLAVSPESAWQMLLFPVAFVVIILIAFADYVIVFENLGVVAALRRSVRLLRHGWPAVLGIMVVLNLVAIGLHALYSNFYDGQTTVFVILPVAQILLDSIVFLFANLLLIFLYEDVRRHSPAG